MEHHGEIPTENVIAIIPARYASTRLPAKMLRDIGGKPVIIRTAERAGNSALVTRVIVATDDRRIFDAVSDAGIETVMTSSEHNSGSDRVAEAAEALPANSIIVNLQGDEPLISPETIDRAVNAMLADKIADIVTVAEAFTDAAEISNPNAVKVVSDANGRALYFSRSPIPCPRDAAMRHSGDLFVALQSEPDLLAHFRKHCGLYVYRREYLLEFTKMPQTRLEKLEMLEQLRALENGAYIKVVESSGRSIGVDTEEDLAKVDALLKHNG